METYKLKFENGRNSTIECDSTQSFQDKINDAENRFNSECCEINGKPIKKHSLGGFLLGATIGALLGNSVPANTISKTATGVKRTAKIVTKKVKSQVKKFSGGGSTDEEKYCRVADDTGKGINEGYVVGDGEMYFETEDGLYKHLKELDYEDADGNSTKKIKSRFDLLEYFYADEYYYYTEWDCEQEIEDQGYYYTADGEEIEIASKGKKLPVGKAPRSWNKDVREYMFFVFNTRSNKVWAGNEYEGDAKDELKEFLLDNPKLPLKVLSKRAITNKKINPLAWENWARSTEIFDEIRGENPEQMAKGSKVKYSTNDARIKALVKDLENTPYGIGLAILRERILTYSDNDLKSLEKNPKAWENPIISLGMYKDYYSRVNKELSFEPRKDNVKAVKGFVKDLENTPYSIGLVILRERLYAYAENDLKAMKKNPDDWSNPFISLGMYQDYANRVIENLKFDYATGGELGSMALAGASPQLAIASQVSQIAPATTSALDRRIASQIDPDRPKWYEDRGMKYDKGGILDEFQEEMFQDWLEDGNVIEVEKGVYATQDAQYRNRIKGMDGLRKYCLKEFCYDSYAKGGKLGDSITFRHWSGDVKKGTINEDLGDGNFDVSSGFGRVLVNAEDIISTGKQTPERKKFLGVFKDGGLTSKQKLEKELQTLQRQINSSRLSTYREGDTSPEEMDRQRERTSKLQRFSEILLILRGENNRTYAGGGSTQKDPIFWIMTTTNSNGTPIKFSVMRGDYLTQFQYKSKEDAEAKVNTLNSSVKQQ